MSNNKKKKRNKKNKRSSRKNSKLLFLVFIVLLIVAGFFGLPYISSLEGTIYSVKLVANDNNDEIIGIGSEYQETGATATFSYLGISIFNRDLSGDIVISYIDKDNNKSENINTTNVNTYQVVYTITYKSVVKTVEKTITVNPVYSVSFENTEGSVYKVSTSPLGTTIDSITAPVNDGYHLIGWYISGDSSETIISFPYLVGGDVTLIAKWAEGSGTDAISFHFLEMGNNYAGDCIYIKAGDNDILIDAGSRTTSVTTTAKYIDNYCTDGTLEYVIATHADQDHIAGFVSTTSVKGIFERYECKLIIDFALSNKNTVLYNNYLSARAAEVEAGAIHYTALQCYNETDGAQRVYSIGEGLTMTILNNYYYSNSSSDENNYSVCLLFSDVINEKYFLLCGDLEKEGEEKLIELNELPEVDLYKANHHGSKTSSSSALLDVIKPKIVTICCVAGSREYTDYIDNVFPTTMAINNIAKYTDQIYVISQVGSDGETVESMNGNIVVSCISGVVSVECSNNNTILKDSEWFSRIVYYIEEASGDSYVVAGTTGANSRPWRTWPE